VSDNGVTARHSSATSEHFTPLPIVVAARETLGAIDLDPFSCAEANETVHAAQFYVGAPDYDGFMSFWRGRVFCNPPGGKTDGQSNQKRAWFKLMREYESRRVDAAIFVCFSLELLQTTQVKSNGSLPLDFPICYPSRRIAYRQPGGKVGKSPPHSSCVILVPPEIDRGGAEHVKRFRKAFGVFGKVVVPSCGAW
jgi:hypothetical protein